MKKTTFKPIVLSALSALAFGAVGTAGTFALFTDKAETQITAEAGVIDVGTTASIFKVFEYNGTEGGLEVAATAEDNYTNSIGGTTKKLQDGTFGLGKWAPGDRVQIKVNASNASTVKAKVRLKAVLSGELAGALVVKIGNDSFTTVELATQGARTLVTDWLDCEPGVAPANFGIEVSFPNVGTEITANSQGENNFYQGKSATLLVAYEAVQANAQTDGVLEAINSKLATAAYYDGNNQTMYAALKDLNTDQVSAIQERGFVWKAENDQFYETSSVQQGEEYKYFKMYASMPDSPTYSVYALNGFSTSQVELTGIGFDAGDASGIQSVAYEGANSARTNVIRTNSYATTVTVNAENDTVKHYGDAASVNIIAVAGSSYHEFGRVAFTEISTGRIVLEEGSETAQIHLNAQDGHSFAPITIANNGVPEAKLPATITRDQIEVSAQAQKELVVTVKDLVNNTHEEVFAYPYSYEEQSVQIPAGTTEKTAEQNVNVETALGMKVIDSNNHKGEKALAPGAKTKAKEDAIDEVIEDEGYVAQISTKFYKTFDAAFDEARNNDVLKVINDCAAADEGIHAYDASGLNLTLEVKAGVTLSCGDITNGKFNIGWSNAAGTFAIDGEGKITFNTSSAWGLVTQNGSGDNIKVTVKNVTLEASSADGKIMTAGNLTVESGHYKNIAFLNGQIKKGFKAEYNPDTGYSDIVVAPPADAVFLATPNDTGVPSEYITPAQIEGWYLKNAPAFSGGNYTLKLLNDHTINESVYNDFRGIIIKGDNIIVDLNGKTLSYIDGSYNLFDGAGELQPHNLTIKNGTLIATGDYFSNIDVETLVFDNVSMALHYNNAVDTFNGYYDADRYFYVDCSQSTEVGTYPTAFMATVYDYVVPGECEYEYSVKAVIGGQNVFCKGSKALYNFTGELLVGDFSFNNSQAGRDIYVYSAQDYKGTATNQTYNLALKQNGTINLHLGENAGTIKVGGPTTSKYAKKISDNGSSATSFYNANGNFYTISSPGTHTLVIS